MKKDFLHISDLTADEILELLDKSSLPIRFISEIIDSLPIVIKLEKLI